MATRLMRGPDAVKIMIEEIGLAIGTRRISEFERKVRAHMRTKHPIGGTANDWINAMAEVITADDDTKADEGFKRGIRRIRGAAKG